ncbi:MAG: zf-TFIIB domain-containing protein [Deltaproteobacteria bacterium]|nr:zf-TFIIB domain-containing protein [Deltaproteobacteria bacterium]
MRRDARTGAAYCSGCGEPLVTVLDAPMRSDRSCPRCKVPMRRRTLGDRQPLECPMCCGLFVMADDFAALMRAQAEHDDRADQAHGPERAMIDLDRDAKIYVPCPGCGEMMNRTNYGDGSGVIIDYCREHGYWLDPGELEKIARWIKSGGTMRKYALDSNDLRRGTAKSIPRPSADPETSPEPSAAPVAEPDDDGDILDALLTFVLCRK